MQKKKLPSKLTLSKETIRVLNEGDLTQVEGLGTSTCGTSNTIDSCDSCVTACTKWVC